MKRILRPVLALALVLSGAAIATPLPASAAPTNDTILVSCTNGFTRTVSARAARGVTTSLNKFNAFNESGITCSHGPGAPKVHPKNFLTVECSNGWERRVAARAAGGIVRALNKFNGHNPHGVTCSIAP